MTLSKVYNDYTIFVFIFSKRLIEYIDYIDYQININNIITTVYQIKIRLLRDVYDELFNVTLNGLVGHEQLYKKQ